MFYIFILKMKINKKIIIFTYDYPTGSSENTFIEFELSKLSEIFEKIEIIPQKNFEKNQRLKKDNISINLGLSKKLNILNLILFFFSHTLFSLKFYNEIKENLFKKNFFKKLKMIMMEATQSEIAFNWIVKNKLDNNKNQIFYSFWSDYLLLTFNKLKKIYDIKAISRALGSDLNGFIKDDDFVPFKDNKFKSMDKIVLLNDYQKDKFQKYSFDDQLKIAPLGVFPQKKNFNEKVDLNEPITFISCGNLIEIKNNFLMIDFLNKFSHQTNKKVKFIMIGDGILKNKILNKIKNLNNIIFEYHKHVENFVDFLNQNKIHFFLNFSSQEGMPFTIMESMSCGIPAIVSSIPPNKYLVNKNGFIFDLNDFTNSISFTISEVNQCVENKDKYLLKSKKSFDFINENLINSNCFEKFKVILNKL